MHAREKPMQSTTCKREQCNVQCLVQGERLTSATNSDRESNQAGRRHLQGKLHPVRLYSWRRHTNVQRDSQVFEKVLSGKNEWLRCDRAPPTVNVAPHQIRYSSAPPKQCQSGQTTQHRCERQAVRDDVSHVGVVQAIWERHREPLEHPTDRSL